MLSIKNITKVYKPKKGSEVTALKDISFNLPEKGMVFLLGKSGSGKSTLMNILGGLDSYTSGEIIIDGKSSKDFKSSDFDAYRNTYIGFVFQEFNILEEYNVGGNIEIAISLQKKKEDRAYIEETMKSVGLDKEYYERKTSELSGGQKQRVAIARALVKNPSVILADEPTGALDSDTGKQVFDTLTKLSANKLVVVVSHDRESAQTYGDRIIELSDGVIIADTSRLNGGEVFATHTEANGEKDKSIESFAMIKSKLPIKSVIKMGAGGLKIRRIRLALSIILSIFTFVIFGLGLTGASFNQNKSEFLTAKENGEKTIMVNARAGIYDALAGKAIYSSDSQGFSPEQIAKVEQLTSNGALKLYNDGLDNKTLFKFEDNFLSDLDSYYYATYLSNLVEVTSERAAGLTPVADGSRLPKEGNYKEIALSDWVADSFIAYGLKNSVKVINNYNDLIGEKLVLKEREKEAELMITGIYGTDVDKDRYADYVTKKNLNKIDEAILSGRDGLLMSMGYVASDFIMDFNDLTKTAIDLKANGLTLWNFTTEANTAYAFNFAEKISEMVQNEKIYLLGGRTLSSLQENEIIISAYALNSLPTTDEEKIEYFNSLGEKARTVKAKFFNKNEGQYKIIGINLATDSSTVFLSDKVFTRYQEAMQNYSYVALGYPYGVGNTDGTLRKEVSVVWKASEFELTDFNIYWGEGNSPRTELGDNEVILNAFIFSGNGLFDIEAAKNCFDTIEKTMLLGKIYQNKIGEGKEIKVVGICLDYEYLGMELMGNGAFDYAKALKQAPLSIIVRLSDDWKRNKELFDYLQTTEKEINGIYTQLIPLTLASGVLNVAEIWIPPIKNVSLYLSVAMCIFAGLMMMNFIGASIVDKQKNIGILRALGARRADIIKIYLCEGLIVGAIIFSLSFVVVEIACAVVNGVFTISVLSPGIAQASLMAALAFGVVILATLIPALRIANRKPIEAINNK